MADVRFLKSEVVITQPWLVDWAILSKIWCWDTFGHC